GLRAYSTLNGLPSGSWCTRLVSSAGTTSGSPRHACSMTPSSSTPSGVSSSSTASRSCVSVARRSSSSGAFVAAKSKHQQNWSLQRHARYMTEKLPACLVHPAEVLKDQDQRMALHQSGQQNLQGAADATSVQPGRRCFVRNDFRSEVAQLRD